MKPTSSELFTLPNAISATGFALAVRGSSNLETPQGLFETAAGRSLDLVDGAVARATGQTSEFGATVDATLDKFAGLAIVVSEWRKEIAPKAALIAMLAQNVVNASATAVAMKRHPECDFAPTKDGKHAMAVQNFALASYAIAGLFKESHPRAHRGFRALGHLATGVGVGYYGVKATAEYIHRAL